MADNRGNLVPMYVLADESGSMERHIAELNAGLSSLHTALLGEPMAAAKVRFSVIGFSHRATVRLRAADLRRENELPLLESDRGGTSYRAAFQELLTCIPRDITEFKQQGYTVHRPAVFMLTDGQPNGREDWATTHHQLTDRGITRAAPNIVACGIGDDVEAATIVQVATNPEYAFVSIPGADVGAAIATFCTALTTSVIESGLSLGSDSPELVVEKPAGFRMAIDVV
ncbi:hypothetical protein GXW83_00985 [Streptacidiphilus sp. PB12-B1b]|uniref:vWA domain-containing protein n=1 Tax=Streptacidiphilus sp. PB12-B1b TaxID=2705012 RepID=UPI0015FD4CCA|nr:hypothetical protein [Streptacidiphilus sp. PB12-B1b]QMU74570.1 hypothetical protein GXW83_00985 [Streptacidiphilus sp. PB12-B1b]